MTTITTIWQWVPRWLQWVLGIIGVSLIIDYWQWSLALAVVAGIGYGVHRQRQARLAKHAAALADIARLEKELRITQ